MKRLLIVVLAVVAVGLIGWAARDRVAGLFGGEEPVAVVSEEGALQAEAKLERLARGGDTVYLSAVEVNSLIRYRFADRFPDLLGEPAVALAGDTLRLRARVPTERLPQVRELERVRSFLPDTAPVEVAGRLGPLEGGRAALEIISVRFSGIPVPEHLYPAALERLGRRDEPGLPPTALPVRLPPGVGRAQVVNGNLVLIPAG